MKTSLFTVALLLVSHLCSAQRFLELTNGSWDQPNLSVETFEDFVISGFTETNPSTGLLTPTFKVCDPMGSPLNLYYVNYPDNAILMDFTIRESTHTIILTGMLDVPPGAMPYKMFVTEVDFMTGAIMQSSLEYPFSGASMIPHQVISSDNSNQVMIVGTEIAGALDPSNFASVPKSGFVLALDITNFNNIVYTPIEMDIPMGFNVDYDMLENITEIPGSHYFISGSCTGPSGEQNLFTMGVDYFGTILFSHVIDKTNSRHAGSSVMYNPALDVVYLMANNSIMHQFQIAQCNPYNGAFITPWFRHQITVLPIGGGVDQNGFRLQQTLDNIIIIGGYLSAPFGAMPEQLTPFQMVLKDNLSFLAAKVYQSGNNSPLSPSYFEENGNSVFINTPDMIAYNPNHKRTYLVNQNINDGGFDLNVSSLFQPSKCEKMVPVSTVTTPHNIIGVGNFNPLPMYTNSYYPYDKHRPKSHIILCQGVAPAMAVNHSNAPGSLLAPNPASDLLTVTLEDETIQDVLVYDMKGNLVLSQKATERTFNEITLGVGKLNQGAYIIEVTTNEGITHRERFVKE
ncbi:hypothetical protein D3C71_746840 [compost metagenome]